MNKALVFFTALIFLFGGFVVFFIAYRSGVGEVGAGEGGDPGVVTKELGAVVDKQYMKTPPDVPADELVTDFILTNQNGELFSSHSLDGQVHVASFFFATCPATCRAQNEAMRELHRDYGRKGVKFLSITVDPENDSPDRLREYASLFGAKSDEWQFLTGDLLYTRRIGAEIYQMHVDKGVHTNRLAIVDKAGKLRGAFDWQDLTQVGKMRKLIDELLAETPSVEPTEDDSESERAPVSTETEPATEDAEAINS